MSGQRADLSQLGRWGGRAVPVQEALYCSPGFLDPTSCEDPQRPLPAGCQGLEG